MCLDEYQPLDQNPMYKNTLLPHSRRSLSVFRFAPHARLLRLPLPVPPLPATAAPAATTFLCGRPTAHSRRRQPSSAAATVFSRCGRRPHPRQRDLLMQAAGGPIRGGDRRPPPRRPCGSPCPSARHDTARHDEALVVPCPGRVLGTAVPPCPIVVTPEC